MKLNSREKKWVGHPVRGWMARKLEAPTLLDLGGPVPGCRVLDLGCGKGVGSRILREDFQAARVDSLDLDPSMVQGGRTRARAAVVGDACALPIADESYDAVFALQVLHHIEDWQSALKEIRRVLRPGGRLYGSETLVGLLQHPILGAWMDHPEENRFTERDLLDGLESAAFRLGKTRRVGKWFLWFVADRPATRISDSRC